MEKRIAVIEGDGIGPEIVREAKKVLDCIGKRFGHSFTYDHVLMGVCAIEAEGVPLPDKTIEVCKKADSVLLGAVGAKVGDERIEKLPGNLRPEAGLLKLRGSLGLFANIRPAQLFSALKEACPLKDSVIGSGLDLVIIRELIGGAYFGKREIYEEGGLTHAYDTMSYNSMEVERIARVAFNMAKKRRLKVTSVDKANVLDSSRLWRKVVHEVAKDYPEVALEDMLVDNTAMQLVRNPGQFDVIVTENLFGDILSDEASMITGSLGMLPSASLGEGTLGLYEPIHGSAPDIAGENKANPLATILSVAMMLRYSFDMEEEASAIESAVTAVLNDGLRTGDIYSEGCKLVTCSDMGDAVVAQLK